MSEQQWSEALIGRALCNQLLNRKCIVLVPNTTWTGYECDVLGVTNDLRVIDIEVKISRSDLKADAKKDKWWQRLGNWGIHGPEWRRPWPEKVWKHYYALPRDIWKSELLEALPSKQSGVLLLKQGRGFDKFGNPWIDVHCERRATPNRDAYRLTAEEAIDVARLANLRMWEMAASAHKQRTRELEAA